MKSLHCLPIKVSSMAELEQRLQQEAEYADVIEVWLDSIKDLRLAEIFFEKDGIQKPFLFVNKVPEEGGDFMGTPEEHIGLLVETFERGARYVDVAHQTDAKLVEKLVKAKGQDDKLIISYHNFEETPGLDELKKIVKEAKKKGADIVKVATFVGELGQNVTLMDLTRWANEESIDIITTGMGENGGMSRVMCPILGSHLYYAPLIKGDETAPGQLTRAELEEIWILMGYL